MNLSHVDESVEESRGSRCHRLECEFTVPNTEFVGKRGGRKIPIEIVWKPCGYGLGTTVFRICGCTILFPYVRYHNGNEKPRTMEIEDWVELTGSGSWKRDSELSEKFKAKLTACETDKSKYSGRVFEIVSSIMKRGGKVTLTRS